MSTNRAKKLEKDLGVRVGPSRVAVAAKDLFGDKKKKKNRKGMTETQKLEFHLLFNSIPVTMGISRKRVQPQEKTLLEIHKMVRYTDPSGNRGIINPDAVQQVNIASLFMNPFANRDSLIFYVETNSQRYLMDGLQTMSTIVRVLNGDLPVPLDEQQFAKAFPDIADDEEGFSKDFLFITDTDFKDRIVYDLFSDTDRGKWKRPKTPKKLKMCLENIALWRNLFMESLRNPNLAIKTYSQDKKTKYACEDIQDKILNEITVPVVELKEENGWDLDSASRYVADIMSNREPLCPHEICMILRTNAVDVVKYLSEHEVVKSAIGRIFDNVRSSHFALVLYTCLLFKRVPGTPGSECTPQYLKSITLQLELDEEDIDTIKTGFERFQEINKFPRPSKERLAMCIAFLASYPHIDTEDVLERFAATQSEMRGDEDGKVFIDSTKDNLMNAYLALERMIEPGEPSTSLTLYTFETNPDDFQIIDLTEDEPAPPPPPK